ncbi:MAG: group III truncated hemoglobin [Gammaproteobacteria bacterium]
MAGEEICSEADITELVHDFYARIQQDPRLGPIFARHISDWPHHLAKMVDFWSSTLRGTRRYRGTPIPAHVALPGLTEELFQDWLLIFHETTADHSNPIMRDRADILSERIAQSLWYGYELQHNRLTPSWPVEVRAEPV